MNLCQHCKRPTQNYLCDDCTNQLHDMLTQIPWLLDELNNRIQKLDRISVGTIGRSRRPDELTVIDFDAVDLARAIRKKLLKWVNSIARHHTGREVPALATVDTADLARWLAANTQAIVRIALAGALYKDINHIVGTNEHGGQLVDAINRQDRTYYGPCTTTVGRDHKGQPRHCGHDLYGPRESIEITCPRCKTTADARKQLTATTTSRDLVTETQLLETLDTMGEPVSRVTLYGWIKSGALTPRGWVHAGRIVAYKVRHKDPRVFSLSQARQLRERDQAKVKGHHPPAHSRHATDSAKLATPRLTCIYFTTTAVDAAQKPPATWGFRHFRTTANTTGVTTPPATVRTPQPTAPREQPCPSPSPKPSTEPH